MHPSNIPALFASSLYNQSTNPTQTPSSSHSSSNTNLGNNADSEPSSAQSSASNSRSNSPVNNNQYSNNKGPFHQPSSRASAASSSSSAAAAQAARMFQSISLNSNPTNSSMSVSPTQSMTSGARMKSEGDNDNGDDVMEDANVEGSNKRRLHLSPAAGYSTLKLKRKLRKNTREKQRRSEINERFDRLSDLLHLTNPSANSKVEKFTVLSEAYNAIENLRKEAAILKSEKQELKVEIHKLNNLINGLTHLQPTAINAMTELDALRAINLNLSSNPNSTTPGMGVRMLGGVMSPLVSPRATMAIAHPAPHAPPGVVGANGTPTPVAMATVVSATDPSGGANGPFFNASPPSANRPLYSSTSSSRPIAKPMTPAVSAVPTYRVTRANTLPSAAPPYSSLNLNHAGHNPPTLNLQSAAQSSPSNIMRANVVNANANGNSVMESQQQTHNINQSNMNSANTSVANTPATITKHLLPAHPPLISSTAQSSAAFSASTSASLAPLNALSNATSPPLVYNSLSSPPTSTSTLGVGMNLLHHRPSVSERVDFSQRRDSLTSNMLVAERRRSLVERRNSFNFGTFGGMSTIGTLPSLTERRPSLSSVFDRRGSITAGLMNTANTLQQALQEKDVQQNNPSSTASASASSSSSSAMGNHNMHPKVHHPHTRDGSTAPLNVLLGNLPQVDQIDALPAMPTLDHLHQNDQNDIFFGNMDDESLGALNGFQ